MRWEEWRLKEPLLDEVPRWRSKKNRKRWCGGHNGREHTWSEWYVRYYNWYRGRSEKSTRSCTKCSRTESKWKISR